MKVFQIDIKSYTDFFQSQLEAPNIYVHPSWFYGMSKQPLVLGYFDDQQQLLAVWPFNKVKRSFGVKCLSQPIFCQSLGPLFAKNIAENRSYLSSHSLYRKIIKSFLNYIRKNGYQCISQGLPASFAMTQYFNHDGICLNYRITYQIPSETNEKEAWEKMHTDHRRKIRSTLDRYELIQDCEPGELWHLKKESLQPKQLSMFPARANFVEAVSSMMEQENACLLGIRDRDNNWKSMAFFGEDESALYYLVGYTVKNSAGDSTSLALLWEGIKKALNAGKNFDFEGTMVASLDRNFRRFGPNAIPYARLEWDRSLTGQLKAAFRNWNAAKKQ